MKTIKTMKFLLGLLTLMFTCFAVYTYFSFDIIDGVGVTLSTIGIASFTLPEKVGAQDGDEDIGGLGVVCYFAPASHIVGYPILNETPTTIDQLVTATGNFLMASGKHFMKLYCAKYPELTPETQGDQIGAKSFKVKGSLVLVGFNKDRRALARLFNNLQGVLIMVDDNGNRIVLGTAERPVTFKFSGSTGANGSDTKNFKAEFETDMFVPGYEYNGTIVLDNEVLS